MGRCRHVNIHTLVCGLIIVTAVVVKGQPHCDDAVAQLESNLITNPSLYYHTCDDYMGIQHGIFCKKKCRALQPDVEYQLIALGCPRGERFTQCEGDERIRRSAATQYSRVKRDIASECDTQIPVCSPNAVYRTFDGSCNNLQNPLWGKSNRGQNRIVPNAFDDGRDTPRSKGCGNLPLPSPRHVSNMLHAAEPTMQNEPRLSLMVMQIGQFLAHDLVLTKLVTRPNGDPVLCCGEDRNNTECLPIRIPPDDPYFPSGGCMNAVRSNARRDCAGIRNPVNSQTAYVDLSDVYGSTTGEANSLRSFSRGQLLTVRKKLPIDFNDRSCQLTKPFHAENYYCTRAGDARVNEQPALASMHTLLVREHNRLAFGLEQVNPHWSDETLFQEARKINIAEWQNIVYGEFLPLIIGPDKMHYENIDISPFGYKDTYSPYVDATIFNAFAVGTLRVGHSLIHRNISMLAFNYSMMMTPEPLQKNFMEPLLYHRFNDYGLDYMLMWFASTAAPKFDRFIEPSVQTFLFQDRNNDSFDLAALNINRGRDHGIPGYNAYRKICRLSPVLHMGSGPGGLVDHDPNTASLLANVYRCPDDIDLFPAVISERPAPGSLIGPTGQCLFTLQFKNLRDGDRYFFERRDPLLPGAGFNLAQLHDIKQVKLSTLICLNTEANFLHPHVFVQPDYTGYYGIYSSIFHNNLELCSTRPGINFNLWREQPFGFG